MEINVKKSSWKEMKKIKLSERWLEEQAFQKINKNTIGHSFIPHTVISILKPE